MAESLLVRKGGTGGSSGGLEIDGVELVVPFIGTTGSTISPGELVSLDSSNGSSISSVNAQTLVTGQDATGVFTSVIDETRLLTCWFDKTNTTVKATVITRTTTTLNIGTIFGIEATASSLNTVFALHSFSSQNNLIVYRNNNGISLRMLGVDLTTNAISSGAIARIESVTFMGIAFSSASTGIIFTRDNNQVSVRRITFTSSTVTIGEPTLFLNDPGASFSISQTGNGEKYIICYQLLNTSDVFRFRVLTISGSTITLLPETTFMDEGMNLVEARNVDNLTYTNTINKIVFFYRVNQVGFSLALGTGFTYARIITFNNTTNSFIFEKRNFIMNKDVTRIDSTLAQTNNILISWRHGNAEVEDEFVNKFAYINFDTATNDVKKGRTYGFRVNVHTSPTFHVDRPVFIAIENFKTPSSSNDIVGFVYSNIVPVISGIRVRKANNNIIGVVKVGGGHLENVTVIFPKNFV
jgi:hypothetical protein